MTSQRNPKWYFEKKRHQMKPGLKPLKNCNETRNETLSWNLTRNPKETLNEIPNETLKKPETKSKRNPDETLNETLTEILKKP